MTVPFKDYYAVLGVPRSASLADIKIAYRRLARIYHPDLCAVREKKEAEERFKEINEAHEVLSDYKKRVLYDRIGASLQGERGYSPFVRGRQGGTRGEKSRKGEWDDIRETRENPWEKGRSPFYRPGHFSDFFQSFFGQETVGEESKKEERDREWHRGDIRSEQGRDVESEIALTLEEVAHGTRRCIPVKRKVLCPFCKGVGGVERRRCLRCQGAGSLLEDKELTVTVPAGVREGDRIRLAGQGNAAPFGWPPGNRFIVVRFKPHPRFIVADDHLEMNMEIMPWEAVFGTDRKIETLFGNVILKIPAGCRSGQIFRLRGKGLPIRKKEKQDLYVRIGINLPVSIPPEERQLYLELAHLAKKR